MKPDLVDYGEGYLSFKRKPTFDEAKDVMTFIDFEEENLAWHHGDLLNAIDDYFGEEASQLVGPKLARKATTRKHVAGKFKPPQRIHTLSFSHHQEVAPIKNIEMRQELLNLADDNGWNVTQLRDEKNRRLGKIPKAKTVECPGCHLVFDPKKIEGE